MFRKYATAAILDARMGDDSRGLMKNAHRAVFQYEPRPGYLYVRSRAISSRCNDNFDYFGPEEIEKAYLSFIGKPVFVNHNNEDHRRARGVIIDAALHRDLNPDGSPDTWVELLHEVDAVKFPKLAKAILAGEVDRTSMGCDVQFSKCSACGNVATAPSQYCEHIPSMKGKRIVRMSKEGKREAQLIFEICSGLSFFENSLLVEQPADPTAYFLGGVELGPGLEQLRASVKTATRKEPTWPMQPHQITSGGMTSQSQLKRTASLNSPSRVWDLLSMAAQETANASAAGSAGTAGSSAHTTSTASQEPSMSVWNLIRLADRIGDDLFDSYFTAPDFSVHVAMKVGEAEDYIRNATSDGKGVQNILNLVGQANHQELKSGMRWYQDAHHIAKTITNHYQSQEGHPLSHDTPEAALHKVAGTIGVYSEGTAPAPNFHYASEALHHGQPIYSHPQYHKDEDGKDVKDEKGKKIPLLDENGKHVNHGFLPETTFHGLPTASSTQAGKVRQFFSGGRINDVMKKAHKTRNYSSLIENPDSQTDEGKDRVVVDRHAVAAVMGHQGSSGDVYNGKGSTFLGRPSGKGQFKDGNYEHISDMYREAAHRINTSPEHEDLRVHLRDSGLLGEGDRVRAHHVQAIAWIKQKQISDAHNSENSGTQRAIDDFHQHYTDRYKGGHQPSSWQGFAGGDQRHGSRRHAYGETKAPAAVDTLRAENCTVCGNSSAFDGTQCQVCGYVAPARPFGDPNTDIAQANDLRKQVLDGTEADPNDPTQQLGNQIGNPDELDDQASDAEQQGAIPPLTCTNCGTGIQPAPAQSTGGEPPYPAEGDICPVCKQGELGAGGEDSEEASDEDADDLTNGGDVEDEGDVNQKDSGAPDTGKDDPDDDEDDDDDEDPKKKNPFAKK